MPESSADAIRHALTVALNHGFSELELEIGDSSFQAKLGPGPNKTFTKEDPLGIGALPPEPESLRDIVAPLVGYYQPAEHPLTVGQTVGVGDIIAVISALGLANDLESTVSGEVVEVLVSPGQSVEYGQVLARVETAL